LNAGAPIEPVQDVQKMEFDYERKHALALVDHKKTKRSQNLMNARILRPDRSLSRGQSQNDDLS
jgi:hypothetical protein